MAALSAVVGSSGQHGSVTFVGQLSVTFVRHLSDICHTYLSMLRLLCLFHPSGCCLRFFLCVLLLPLMSSSGVNQAAEGLMAGKKLSMVWPTSPA